MMKKIAILGANYQYKTFYRQTKALGYEIYAFGRASDDHVSAEEYADHFYDISFTEKERILEICKREGVQGVTSFLIESALPYVYYISRGLGVPCNSPECEALTANKYTMREQMRKNGVSIPAYKAVHSIEEVNGMPFPIIVKPSDSGGSRGITLVRKGEELNAAIERAMVWSPSKTILIEQFIEGREFSVESISYKGKHYILQITDKETTGAPYFVELSHHQPADLNTKQWDDIKNLTISMLNCLKVEYGASHTEVKMDADGIPYVIEMGPRMGGGFITSDLVKLSTGYDFVKGVLEVSTGSFTVPQFSTPRYAGIYFLCEETRKRVLPYIENRNDYPFVVDADIYGKIQKVFCNSDRGGYFIYQSDKKVII
ncbi:MAG: ATP-grasp domain-containing protein [Bacteroidaceae bacterium]|nr:ATP-grasp domain-containing protein [Bacteroidaceae bacterium]